MDEQDGVPTFEIRKADEAMLDDFKEYRLQDMFDITEALCKSHLALIAEYGEKTKVMIASTYDYFNVVESVHGRAIELRKLFISERAECGIRLTEHLNTIKDPHRHHIASMHTQNMFNAACDEVDDAFRIISHRIKDSGMGMM